ncbi:MAG: hypothetical protein HY918_00745 [Candidatus Doudnabacteria bacterium]|nr:hypothetical protein [Candidatus Doudnabacteria bacterium]
MKKIYSLACGAVVMFFVLPGIILATGTKTITGYAQKISGSTVVLASSNGAKYSAEVGQATLTRKNGAPMRLTEILVGDKVEVKGILWGDNSISASSLRNMSLYTHNGSFSGKITEIDPWSQSFTLQSSKYGNQTIKTDSLTVFKKNGSSSTFKDLELGMSMTVKGAWDRSTTVIAAREVNGTLRLINIDFTGTLTMKSDGAITVIGNGNVIYGVDITKAKLQNKSGKTLSLSLFNLSDTIRVQGKHVSGSVKVLAETVKDLSVTK